MPWRGPQEPGEFPTLGYLIGQWIQTNCVIPDGVDVGKPYVLTPEMWKYLLWCYRLNPDAVAADGADAFVYGGSMLVRSQKWGKDPLLGARCIAHAFGPVSFDGWDADGEPVGKHHPTPWVAVAATNDQQTDNTFRPIRSMLTRGPLADLRGLEADKSIVKMFGVDVIEPLTTTAWGRLGAPFSFVSITEAGILVGDGPRGGLTFSRTLKRNVGGMNGMWAAATNFWDPTEHSDGQETWDAKDPHVYIDARLARCHVDIDDDEALEAEIRYQYGDSAKSAGGWVSEQRIKRDVRNKAYGEAEVRRFYLGEIVAGERALVHPERLAKLARAEEQLLQPGDRITLGFDGSRSRDATVLTACRISDGRLFHLRTWIPAEHNDHRIPRPEVDQAVRDAFDAYEVWYLFADPYKWQEYLDVWAGAFPNRVVEVPTNVERRMDDIITRFNDGITTGELTYADPAEWEQNQVLVDHLHNAALAKGKRKPVREGDDGSKIEHYLKVVKKREGLLIDGCVSGMLTYDARGKAIEDGALQPPPQDPIAIWG